MDLNLKGKRVLVQGSSGGLGFAIAEAFVGEGARVLLCSRNETSLATAAKRIGTEGFVVADLSQAGGGGRSVSEAIKKLGGLDVLVTNTGGPAKGLFKDLKREAWVSGFESLFMSAIDSIQTALPAMELQKWGRILLVTSTAAREPIVQLNVSNGFRAGLLGLTKSISNEVAASGITVNALLPGYTATERLKELKVSEDKIVSQIPAGRIGRPDELAALACFLGSDKASYITGQSIACDGGYLRGY
jgi:3-oxoacyl-[acyl-carrier protein] reductase